jgi:3-oxoacyl-[acyl-carrier protein] reductase
MDLRLKDKVAIVTGASRGIGRAIAETLGAEGMRVVLAARTLEDLKATAAAIETETRIEVVDLREADAPARLIANTIEHFGSLDVLVNNAGATKRGDFHALTDDDWHDGFALKFFGTMRLCRSAWPHLAQRHGNIVNIVGIGGRTGSAEFTIGGTVNAAIMNLTKALADKGIKDGVRVNAINPGAVLSDRLQTRVRSFASENGIDLETAKGEFARTLGIARFGETVDIARTVAFLASPLAHYCQGSIVDVDGGQTRTL